MHTAQRKHWLECRRLQNSLIVLLCALVKTIAMESSNKLVRWNLSSFLHWLSALVRLRTFRQMKSLRDKDAEGVSIFGMLTLIAFRLSYPCCELFSFGLFCDVQFSELAEVKVLVFLQSTFSPSGN